MTDQFSSLAGEDSYSWGHASVSYYFIHSKSAVVQEQVCPSSTEHRTLVYLDLSGTLS